MELPKIDLTTFFLSISYAAMQALETQATPDFELAKHNIELLELMHEKTRGNRTPEEDKLIDQLLFDSRMRFIDAQKKR